MRTAIFIDGLSLYHGLHGRKIDFRDLKSWLVGSDICTHCYYFNRVDSVKKKHLFLSHVEKSGFELYVKDVKSGFSDTKYKTTDMDIELTALAMLHINEYDKFILVSGKTDFAPLCHHISSFGKTVEVINIDNNISSELSVYATRNMTEF